MRVYDVCLSVDTHVLECGYAMASVWRSFRSWLSPSSMGFKEARFFRVAKPFHWPPRHISFFKKHSFSLYGQRCFFLHMCMMCVPGAHSQRRTSAPPVLEEQMTARWRMGARNPAQVLCRSRKSLRSTRPLPAPRYISWLTLRHKLINIWPWNMLQSYNS